MFSNCYSYVDSIDSSPDSSARFSPYASATKKAYIRPGTPSPASSTSTSPWISHITPEKLRKLRPSFSEPPRGDINDSRSTVSNSSTMQSLAPPNQMKRDSHSTRFATLSPETNNDVDDDIMTPIDLNESSTSAGQQYEWRQTDDDEETWEHDD